VPLWTNLLSLFNKYSTSAAALAVDGNGNVCVTGYAIIPGAGFDYYAYATVKYSDIPGISWLPKRRHLAET
jgi:hypothetical protein